MPHDWNQEFKWTEIIRVCFKDEAMWSSGVLYLSVVGREKPFVVLVESKGGVAFFKQLIARKMLPIMLYSRAIAHDDGATYCWPTSQEKQ
jgi:hypothetical protein